MSTLQYLRPERLDEALGALGRRPWSVLAGGTDFYPARVGKPVEVDVLDITRIADLRGIRVSDGAVRIGATATWSELIAADLPPVCDSLKAAAREVGGVQIQNAGTVAGNLCNASPAADGVPPLLALGAEVELASGAGSRRLPLGEFVLGNRKTARRPNELVVAVHVPAWPPGAQGAFVKLGQRRYLVISIVMVAACVALDAEGRITRCGVAVGACSAAAKRLTALEEHLAGMRPADAAASVTEADLSGLTPIADVRGSAEYRFDAAVTLVRQAIAQAGRR
jgi:CO/xanthine dehydrogenase FAD-binding subunit